jgi:hypothetical protein
VILSGWSQGTGDRGLARVSFVNADDPQRLTYASALLVVPVDGGRDYRALSSRLSGMVWYQGKLLVTAPDGLYVYDMHRVQRTTVHNAAVGRISSGWAAHGYRFVLPAVGFYRPTAATAAARLSSISLDRSTAPDSLVAAEWTSADSDRHAVLSRYSFDSTPARAGLLATGSARSARAVEAFETEAAGIEGVLSYRSLWYVDRAPTATERQGSLWRQDAEGAVATRCGASDAPRCWGVRGGALSYSEATGEVWSQSGTVLFAVPLSSIDKNLG